MNDAARLNGVKWVAGGALLLAMGLAPHLWLADRAFPTIPALQGLPELAQAITLALAGLFVAGVIAVMIHPRPGVLVGLTLATAALLVPFDLTGLQPRFYFYIARKQMTLIIRDQPGHRQHQPNLFRIGGVVNGH